MDIQFKFEEAKATAAAGLFMVACGEAGERINYMKLLKLLYIMERKSLQEWGMPVVGGQYVSMDYGPVLCEVYDLILGRHDAAKGLWRDALTLPEDYIITLKCAPDLDVLSESETSILNAVVKQFGHYTEWELSGLCHELFPEWTDPNGSSIPIPYESLLKEAGKNPDQIYEIRRDADELKLMDSVFGVG